MESHYDKATQPIPVHRVISRSLCICLTLNSVNSHTPGSGFGGDVKSTKQHGKGTQRQRPKFLPHGQLVLASGLSAPSLDSRWHGQVAVVLDSLGRAGTLIASATLPFRRVHLYELEGRPADLSYSMTCMRKRKCL
jgi:hypothetical protein